MEKTCELLVTEDKGLVLAGYIKYNDGVITGIPADGYENVVPNVMDADVGPYKRSENPTEWFDNLPKMYHGTMFQARMVVNKVDFSGLLTRKR